MATVTHRFVSPLADGPNEDQVQPSNWNDTHNVTINWGDLEGTLSDQIDLQSALDDKLDSSSYTASDVLTKLLTVDGSGSNLDADLLDGQHGSYYQNASNLNSGTVSNDRLPQSIATTASPIFAAVETGLIKNPPTTIADDNVLFIPISINIGHLVLITSGSTDFRRVCTFSIRTPATSHCRKIATDTGVSDPFETTTGALSPGDGTDEKITVSAGGATQGIYISNRSGAAVNVATYIQGNP